MADTHSTDEQATKRVEPPAGAWDAYYEAYSEFRDNVEGWKAFFTDHHTFALGKAPTSSTTRSTRRCVSVAGSAPWSPPTWSDRWSTRSCSLPWPGSRSGRRSLGRWSARRGRQLLLSGWW